MKGLHGRAGRHLFRVREEISEIGARAGDILTLSDRSFTINREMPYELSYLVRRDYEKLEPVYAEPEPVGAEPERPARRHLRLVK